MKPVTRKARSEHLAAEGEGEVLAVNSAPYPTLGPLTRLPVGATLIEKQLERGMVAPSAYFAMVKRPAGYDPKGGDWEYLVFSPEGRLEGRGVLPLCARCHADAPYDHLFGGGR